MASSTHKRLRPDSDDDEHEASTIFTSQENFARYLIIESKNKEKPVTSLSPFVIEKQIESMIGTAKSVKKLKNGTLLVAPCGTRGRIGPTPPSCEVSKNLTE